MPTTLDVITRTLRLIGVVAGDEAPEANDAAASLEVLNNMMFSWKARGVDTEHTTLDLATAFPLADEYIRPVVYLLGAELADEYKVSQPNMSQVRESWTTLSANYFVATLASATVDNGLLRMPSQFNYGNARSNANS